MTDPREIHQQNLMRQWVETWRVAGRELEEIRRREIAAVDTCEAVEQIFGTSEAFCPSCLLA